VQSLAVDVNEKEITPPLSTWSPPQPKAESPP
jgi:hypothetical protein